MSGALGWGCDLVHRVRDWKPCQRDFRTVVNPKMGTFWGGWYSHPRLLHLPLLHAHLSCYSSLFQAPRRSEERLDPKT